MENINENEDFLKNLCVLYVEDEESSRIALGEILSDYVKEIILAKDGKEALEIFKEGGIDLVISDILMPQMDGLELVKNIRNMESMNLELKNNEYDNFIESKILDSITTPIILATAFSQTQFLLDSIKLKCDGYVLKPINVDELLCAMTKAYLPRFQTKSLQTQNRLLKTLSAFYGGKKIEIIQYLIEHCDESQIFNGSIENIADNLQISRQTVAKAFQELIEAKLIEKIKNKTYKLCNF